MIGIRAYQHADLASLRRVCLLTGDSGQNAESLYSDRDLLGDYYAAPYAQLYPEYTFVLAKEDSIVGYALGVPDSAIFGRRCELEWFPQVRARLRRPDKSDRSSEAAIVRRVFIGHPQQNRFADFPAHLHIDLLPLAQNAGWGRRLIDALLEKMRAASVPGVHLGVGKMNQRAIGFYEHLGFQLIADDPAALVFGKNLRVV